MDLKDCPASAVGDFKRAFLRTADMTVMRKLRERRVPPFVSEKEVADGIGLPYPLVR